MRISGNDIRSRFLAYMESKGHAIIPSSSLVPENDPTTLFTGSGMQPLVPYLMGETHPKGTRLADSQKSFRAEDIEEVGDNRHTTFFEMLGNWSLGDYFKKEQLPWFYEFLTKEVGLEPERIFVTVFLGSESDDIPKDDESVAIWQELFKKQGISAEVAVMGSEEEGGKRGMKEGERIFFYDSAKNWWSRAGKPENMPVGEIGGPDSEVFYDFGTTHDETFGPHCHPNCDCGRFLEIGNSVFMEYIKTDKGFQKLPKQNVDFGGGLERIAAAANGDPDVFKVDLLYGVVSRIETLSGKKYDEYLVPFRVITDHIRGAVFMVGDGVHPSNTEQGYFVRRLIRRAVRFADVLQMPENELKNLASAVIEMYGAHYNNLIERKYEIERAIEEEEAQFRKTLKKGLELSQKLLPEDVRQHGHVTGVTAYTLYTTYGFPFEFTRELAEELGSTADKAGFDVEMKKHQDLSRAGAEQKFKGGLADHSEKVVAYHTATHLLLAGLRKELGESVHQAGSNITAERLRFDFTYPDRVPKEILERVEAYVNEAIRAGAIVTIDTMKKNVAEADSSIEGSFWERYPDEVKVYTIQGTDGTVYSRELCGGPHVETTGTISGTFKIVKEESSAHGIRRIKAILE